MVAPMSDRTNTIDGSTDQSPAPRRGLSPVERRRQIAEMLRADGHVTTAALGREFGMSPMTLRRDLAVLTRAGVGQRTHDGAALVSTVGYEDSFLNRVDAAVEKKRRLAEFAFTMIEPGDIIFLDATSTTYHLATLLLGRNPRVTVLTNSAPIIALFSSRAAADASLELIGIGGSLRKLTLSFVGPQTVRAVRDLYADKAFISVKGISRDGHLTDPDPLDAEVKRSMIEQTELPVLLAGAEKFDQRGLVVIASASTLGAAVIAGECSRGVEMLSGLGVDVHEV